MRAILCLTVWTALAGAQPAQRAVPMSGPNLPAQPIGANDLINVSVYDAPEFSGTIRVGADGNIRIPMLRDCLIKAQGLLPADLEASIAEALVGAQMLVDPLVTVTIAEYHSRPITVSGAVKKPVVFQAEGPTTLLEAMANAEGLREDAGPDILVTRTAPDANGQPKPEILKISARGLIDGNDPALNLTLTGGEEIRVPQVSKIFVVGNVKKPAAVPMQDTAQTTVLETLALVEGLAPYASKTAYIYRADGAGKKQEIAVPLNKILKRKAPDVPLVANDIFYVPDRTRQRMSVAVLERVVAFGTSAGATALIYGAEVH
jgi:polysaccharide export outer membrane protein